MPSMFISVHTLHSVPFNNLNSDGNGRPKVGWFGGAQRSRVSSQSLKRARRQALAAQGLPGAVRTRLILDMLTAALIRRGRDQEEARDVARAGVEALGLGFDKAQPEATEYLLFVGEDEIERAGDILHQGETWDALLEASRARGQDKQDKKEDKKEDKKTRRGAEGTRPARDALLAALQEPSDAVDLALFGRMVADRNELSVDAAVQVAHSLGVARYQVDSDFWVGVDDLNPDSGAAILGTTWFSTSVLYGYTAINVGQLTRSLGRPDLVRKAVQAYITATVEALPSGRQNSFSSPTPPSLVLTVTGPRCPWSLANAFIQPVRGHDEVDLVKASITALDTYLRWTRDTFGYESESARVAGFDLPVSGLVSTSVEDLVKAVADET